MKAIGTPPHTNPQTDTTIYFKADNLSSIVVEFYGIAGISVTLTECSCIRPTLIPVFISNVTSSNKVRDVSLPLSFVSCSKIDYCFH